MPIIGAGGLGVAVFALVASRLGTADDPKAPLAIASGTNGTSIAGDPPPPAQVLTSNSEINPATPADGLAARSPYRPVPGSGPIEKDRRPERRATESRSGEMTGDIRQTSTGNNSENRIDNRGSMDGNVTQSSSGNDSPNIINNGPR